MINLITMISVLGITIITASLIILLSAFNGIEKMIEDLYSEFDTDITVRIKEGKRFSLDRVDLDEIRAIEGVASYTRALEEVVILKHEDKWINADLLGIDSSFLEITHMDTHMVAGAGIIEDRSGPFAIVGASLLDKLNGYIPESGYESVICYAPKRDMKIKPGKSPFTQRLIRVSGQVNFNREVNLRSFIMPFELAEEVLNLKNQASAIYIDANEGVDNEDLKARLEALLGPEFVVKTNFEKNQLIYMTSKSEKVVVLIILLFIFILAAFNLVASLTMLFVEKLENIQTMNAMGANKRMIFSVFFVEGLMISFVGIFLGFIIGYTISFLQMEYGFVIMPNSGDEAFPVRISMSDGILIFFLVTFLSALFSYLPVKYLIRKNLPT